MPITLPSTLPSTTRINRSLSTAAAVLALGVLGVGLTACGSDDPSASSAATERSTTEHNDADVAFATEMIQHHAQALAMVDLTVGRDLDPEVQSVVDGIREAQAPEIETMADWLGDWGVDVPATVRDHAGADAGADQMDDMYDGMGDMPGMMSADDMRGLGEADDASFPDMWLEMMVEHHEGALEMAATEESDGQYQPAVDLAASITSSQTEEIATMKALVS